MSNHIESPVTSGSLGLPPTQWQLEQQTRLKAQRLCSMLSVAELDRRPSRPPDYEAENRALVALATSMALSPEGILQKFADTALVLCRAHSAGFSLLEDSDQKRNFHWRAIVGQWASHVGGGTPRDFGPCGTVLDNNNAMLCCRPDRDFPYFGDVLPLLDEGLLIPFYVDGEAVGTIWVISHDESRRFDSEDLRVMTSLATFASTAYLALLSRDQAQSEFARAARLSTLGELTGSIAHEVNQPLTAIFTNSETALRWLDCLEPNVAKARELVQRNIEEARRAAAVVTRVRAMASGRVPQLIALSLHDVINDAIAFLSSEMRETNVSTSLDLLPTLPKVRGDRIQLQQVVVNLVINATQAMAHAKAARRTISIQTMMIDERTIGCAVEDSGPGIDPQHFDCLFDSFFTTKDSGMGLGLPVSRSIIEAHHGELRANNNSSLGGARFSFSLPVDADPLG